MVRFWSLSKSSPPNLMSHNLDSSLSFHLPLPKKCRREVLELCWRLQLPALPSDEDMAAYDFYFRHYEEHCSNASFRLRACSHRHACQAVQQLSKGTRETCERALFPLLPAGSDAIMAGECINFAAKAILFIDTKQWQGSETLSDFLARTIASKSTQTDEFRIPRAFNARSFAKVAAINVQWTRDLASHLEVTGNDSDIAIFHCVTVIDLYEQEQSTLGSLFPDGFLAETRRTLSLMLPIADSATRSWFKSEQKRLKLDPSCGSCPHLKASQRHIRDFDFWRDRLIMAKEVFDEHQPKGILQFWRDDRNPVQWWTFWVAIIVFLLTLIACIEGALQVYKAYHPSK